jgi:hypothetical protein
MRNLTKGKDERHHSKRKIKDCNNSSRLSTERVDQISKILKNIPLELNKVDEKLKKSDARKGSHQAIGVPERLYQKEDLQGNQLLNFVQASRTQVTAKVSPCHVSLAERLQNSSTGGSIERG